MSAETCPVRVGEWASYPCGRPVKRNGKCGIHAAAEERVKRNDEHRRNERESVNRQTDELTAKAERLRAFGLGFFYLETTPINYNSVPTGRVVVDLDALLAALEGRS